MKKRLASLLLLLSVLLWTIALPARALAPVDRETILQRAVDQLGKPYEWGASGPDSFDASGLVSYCITGRPGHIGVPATFLGWPRVTDPQPGDICVSEDHCGIYVGGRSMIHVKTFGTLVCYGAPEGDMVFVRVPDGIYPPAAGDGTPLLLCGALLFTSALALPVCLWKKS